MMLSYLILKPQMKTVITWYSCDVGTYSKDEGGRQVIQYW
jgi:hypothetical protein